MSFAERHAEFFGLDDFAIEAVFEDGARVNGIFIAQYLETLGMASSGPAFTCASADVRTRRPNETLEAAGSVYRITGIEPDGTGVTTLRLVKT